MNELDKLDEMLTDAGIPFERIKEACFDKYGSFHASIHERFGEAGKWLRNQIIYGRDNHGSWKFDAICQFGSHGAKQGLVETYGTLGVDDIGEPRVMTASEAFKIIKNDWEEGGEENG